MHTGRQRIYTDLNKLSDSIDQHNARAILAFVETLRDNEKSMVLPIVISRWAELDPQAAVAYAQNLPVGSFRNRALTSAISGWAEHDTAAAMAWVDQMPPGQQREQAMQTIVSALADKDPKAALTFLAKPPTESQTSNLYWPIFSRWTMTDPLAAAQQAPQMPAGTNRDTALQVIGSSWANQDPEAAYAWANTLPAGQGRNNALQNIFASWANKDPQKAASMIDALPAGSVRDQSISNIARQWAITDVRAALKWTEDCPSAMGNKMPCVPFSQAGFNRSLRRRRITWQPCRQGRRRKKRPIDRDPIGRKRCPKRGELGRKNFRPDPRSQNALTNILSQWGDADPQAAADFALQIPKRMVGSNLLENWRVNGRGLIRKRPWRGLEICPGQPRDAVFPNVIAAMAETDLREAAGSSTSIAGGRSASQLRAVQLSGNGPVIIRRPRADGLHHFRKADASTRL